MDLLPPLTELSVFDLLSTLAITISASVAYRQYKLKEKLAKDAEDRENARLRLNLYKRLKRNARNGPHEPHDTLKVEAARCGVGNGDIDVLLHYQAAVAATYVENVDEDDAMEKRQTANRGLRRILLDDD